MTRNRTPLSEHARTATWDGAPFVGDRPISLDRMAELLGVDDNTPYTWSHRDVLPRHDGVNGRSRYWWESKILAWHDQRDSAGGRPRLSDSWAA